ncbi:MAG: hypothetical protein NPIRA03_19950 [Nitrospirales bacterium]|nr:MAG: hypothetical protein NPIRA03_19950 [Nitrospirales bacterium]
MAVFNVLAHHYSSGEKGGQPNSDASPSPLVLPAHRTGDKEDRGYQSEEYNADPAGKTEGFSTVKRKEPMPECIACGELLGIIGVENLPAVLVNPECSSREDIGALIWRLFHDPIEPSLSLGKVHPICQ